MWLRLSLFDVCMKVGVETLLLAHQKKRVAHFREATQRW
jgi:hypothetical protein